MFTTILLATGVVIFSYLFYVGLVHIFNKDLSWKWQEDKNRRRGITNSERTSEWESQRTYMGCVLTILSLVMIVLFSMTLLKS